MCRLVTVKTDETAYVQTGDSLVETAYVQTGDSLVETAYVQTGDSQD